MGAFDGRSFCIDVRVIARWTGSRAYEGSTIVVDVPICIGSESPEVVGAIDMIIGGFKKDQGDGNGETDKIVVCGLSIDGEEEGLDCYEG
jgi:hypothetical protein